MSTEVSSCEPVRAIAHNTRLAVCEHTVDPFVSRIECRNSSYASRSEWRVVRDADQYSALHSGDHAHYLAQPPLRTHASIP